jgi:hypothetical protein
MKPKALGLAVAATLVSLFVASDACADAIGVEAAVKGGAATNFWYNTPDPMGVGLGGRAGLTFLGIYGGVSAVYYFGSSQTVLPPSSGGAYTVSAHTFAYGMELGYGVTLDRFTIRPQVGIGNLESNTVREDTEKSYLYLEPGVVGLVAFGHFLLGADLNMLLLPAGPPNTSTLGPSSFDWAFTTHLQAGVKF